VINGMFNALSGLKNSAQKLQKSATNLQSSFEFEKKINIVGEAKPEQSELIGTDSISIDISKEVVTQITAKATFTANAKVVAIADQIIGTALDIKS
jgi:flagellar basal body rod protein FlgG